MKRARGMLWRFGVLTFLGMGLVSLTIPWPAQAGGVHVSVGLGIPVPVVVAPAPVYVQPAPVYVQRPPVVVHQPSVVVAEPYAWQAYYPYSGHGGWRRARHWRHHGYDR